MIARRLLAGMVVLGALIVSPGAAAKAFRPGDMRVCSGQRCLPIRSQRVLDALAAFYYDTAERPVRTMAPTGATPSFKLEFSNGYVSGTVGGSKLDRFRSGGVNLDQFRDGVWYRLPIRVATELRAITVGVAAPRYPGNSASGVLGIIALASAIVLIVVIIIRGRLSRPRKLSLG